MVDSTIQWISSLSLSSGQRFIQWIGTAHKGWTWCGRGEKLGTVTVTTFESSLTYLYCIYSKFCIWGPETTFCFVCWFCFFKKEHPHRMKKLSQCMVFFLSFCSFTPTRIMGSEVGELQITCTIYSQDSCLKNCPLAVDVKLCQILSKTVYSLFIFATNWKVLNPLSPKIHK